MTNICPKCNNPYLRHKGKKKKVKVVYMGKEKDKDKTEWTEDGYYCKRCGFGK